MMTPENDKDPVEKDATEKPQEGKKPPKPPEISPYVFPVLLAGFGLWCFYDGWLTTNVEMLEHQLFNRVVSGILLPWAGYDFLKVRKYERRAKRRKVSTEDEDSISDDNPA